MNEAIGQLAPIASQGLRAAAEPHPQTVALQSPTQTEAANFAQAVAKELSLETSAAAPPSGEPLSTRLAAQADRLTSHLQALGSPQQAQDSGSGPTGPSPQGHGLGDARAQMGDSVAQIERAYMFAIETTMASRGSTESTKIFNTLLKGQ